MPASLETRLDWCEGIGGWCVLNGSTLYIQTAWAHDMVSSDIEAKLGWKPGMVSRVSQLPDDLAGWFSNVLSARGDDPVWHLIFVTGAAELEAAAGADIVRYQRGQHLWVAYPKKSSKIKTDIDRDHGWEPIRALDLHAVTQVSVSPTWSALRLRYRDEIKSFSRKF